MVSQVEDQTLLADDEDLGDGHVTDVDADAERSGEDNSDPLAALRQEFGERITSETARVRQELERKYGGEIGRAQKVEKRLEEALSSLTPAGADALTDEAVTALVRVFAASELLDDTSRATLRSIDQRLSEARTKREREALKREAIAEIRGADQKEPEDTTEPQQRNPEAEAATARVLGYAEAKGVDPARIPTEAWALLPGEALSAATARVKKVIDDLAAGTATGARVAERRGAAGTGSPGRGGGGSSTEQTLKRLETEGIPLSDEAARKAALEALGL